MPGDDDKAKAVPELDAEAALKAEAKRQRDIHGFEDDNTPTDDPDYAADSKTEFQRGPKPVKVFKKVSEETKQNKEQKNAEIEARKAEILKTKIAPIPNKKAEVQAAAAQAEIKADFDISVNPKTYTVQPELKELKAESAKNDNNPLLIRVNNSIYFYGHQKGSKEWGLTELSTEANKFLEKYFEFDDAFTQSGKQQYNLYKPSDDFKKDFFLVIREHRPLIAEVKQQSSSGHAERFAAMRAAMTVKYKPTTAAGPPPIVRASENVSDEKEKQSIAQEQAAKAAAKEKEKQAQQEADEKAAKDFAEAMQAEREHRKQEAAKQPIVSDEPGPPPKAPEFVSDMPGSIPDAGSVPDAPGSVPDMPGPVVENKPEPVIKEPVIENKFEDVVMTFHTVAPEPKTQAPEPVQIQTPEPVQKQSSEPTIQQGLDQHKQDFLKQIYQEACDPKWDTKGQGIFGKKTPDGIKTLRKLGDGETKKYTIEDYAKVEKLLDKKTHKLPLFGKRHEDVSKFYQEHLDSIKHSVDAKSKKAA